VRCSVKSENERNLYLLLLTGNAEYLKETAGVSQRKEKMMSDIMTPMNWATHVIQWLLQRAKSQKAISVRIGF
jgi:hypothetical protein